MTKLVEFEGDMIRLTPDGEKLAEDLRAGRVTVDDYFDKALQNMIDNGFIARVGGDNLQITEKGAEVYRIMSGQMELGGDDGICEICNCPKRKDCGPGGWLEVIGLQLDGDHITALPCPNKAPS